MYHGGQHQMRAAHADRERATDVLRAGFAEGRLTHDEYLERVDQAQRAVTYGELERLTGDLPQGAVGVPAPWQPAQAQPVPATFLPPPKPSATNGAAIGSMICGVGTLFTAGVTAIPAVVLGHRAHREIRRTGERGEAYATTGLVFGYLALVFWVLAVIGGVLFLGALHSGGSALPDAVPATDTVRTADG